VSPFWKLRAHLFPKTDPTIQRTPMQSALIAALLTALAYLILQGLYWTWPWPTYPNKWPTLTQVFMNFLLVMPAELYWSAHNIDRIKFNNVYGANASVYATVFANTLFWATVAAAGAAIRRRQAVKEHGAYPFSRLVLATVLLATLSFFALMLLSRLFIVAFLGD